MGFDTILRVKALVGYMVWDRSDNSNSDYFQPLHVVHLIEWCPEVVAYLGLPPGWRFLIASHQVNVWFDQICTIP